MIAVPRWRVCGIVVCALSGAAAGCAQPNPAFDADGQATVGDAATTKDGPGDEGMSASSEGGDTRAEGTSSATSSATEPVDPSTTDAPATTTQSGSESGGVCTVAEHAPFSVELRDVLTNPIPLQCGQANLVTGTLSNAGGDGVLVLDTCGAGACACKGKDFQSVTAHFVDLDPAPDPTQLAGTPCITLSVHMATPAEGCGVEAAVIENAGGTSDFPLYIATNGFSASSLSLPTISLGEPSERCGLGACDPDPPPGTYSLIFGDAEPISPGGSGPVTMNPFAGVAANYEVFDRYSYVDEACTTHVGWAAVWTDT